MANCGETALSASGDVRSSWEGVLRGEEEPRFFEGPVRLKDFGGFSNRFQAFHPSPEVTRCCFSLTAIWMTKPWVENCSTLSRKSLESQIVEDLDCRNAKLLTTSSNLVCHGLLS